MALAVKNTPEVGSPSPFDRVPIVGLVGAAYIIGCLGVLGKALPYLWWETLGIGQSATTTLLLIFVLAAAACGLGYLGLKLLGPRAAVGTRAAVFVAFLGVLLILLLTRWASLWIEYWVFFRHSIGDNGTTIGPILTAVIGVALLGVAGYFFLDKRFEPYLVKFEEQGWFSATTYKSLQGLRVRRGTIAGILLIVGSGIYTLLSQGILQRGPTDWSINVPFTGKVLITNDTKGDIGDALAARFPNEWDAAEKRLKQPVWMSRYELRDIDDKLNGKVLVTYSGLSERFKDKPIVDEKAFKEEVEKLKDDGITDLPEARPLIGGSGDEVSRFVKITSPGDSTFAEGAIVPLADFEAEVNRLRPSISAGGSAVADAVKAPDKTLPTKVPLSLSSGTEIYYSLTLLPALQFTIPLLLIAVSLWIAWRAVNYPAFADFLIATEAELNKVSWSTRRRLMQDTVVVLITVALTAVFLFATDMTWSHLLSLRQIGVIQKPTAPADPQKVIESRRW
jgi:preprotein translocase SecE subunit